MRIFVSGATGVIGRRVVPVLLAQGHSVTDYNTTVVDTEKSVERFSGSGGTGVALPLSTRPDAMQVRSYINILRIGWAPLPGGPARYISDRGRSVIVRGRGSGAPQARHL